MRQPGRAGHTLTELIVALFISVMIIAAVMSMFLLLGRTSTSVASYGTMAVSTSQGLEKFAQDIRMASNVVWNGSDSITLTVPGYYAGTSNKVTYAYDTDTTSDTYECFFAMPGSAGDGNPRDILVRQVSDFSFARFNRLDATTTSDAETKRIQVGFTATGTGVTLVKSTNSVISASFILRNKRVN